LEKVHVWRRQGSRMRLAQGQIRFVLADCAEVYDQADQRQRSRQSRSRDAGGDEQCQTRFQEVGSGGEGEVNFSARPKISMKANKGRNLTFKDLPCDYEALCSKILLPRPIRSRGEYEEVSAIADIMAPFIRKFSAGQDEYFEMLASLLEDFDRKNVSWPQVSGVEAFKHLLDENQMSPADLSRLIGGSRNLGAMILRGDRNITVDHVRTLADRFGVGADLFIK
jgi:antitoxin component HigA of HigAB toxin-antitoxin module